MRPLFILNCGCQKGGTSWLHSFLSAQPGFLTGPVRDLHVLSMYFQPHQVADRILDLAGRLADGAAQIINAPERSQTRIPSLIGNINIANMTRVLDLYFNYFQSLSKADGARAVMDLSPTYACLNADNFRLIRDRMVDAQFSPKFIFIMRDPADRILSAARMEISRRTGLSGKDKQDAVMSVFRHQYRSAEYKMRTNYHTTAQALISSVPETERHITLFEHMFTNAGAAELANFLELGDVSPPIDKVVFSHASGERLDQAEMDMVYGEYKEVYDFSASLFGEKLIQKYWASFPK